MLKNLKQFKFIFIRVNTTRTTNVLSKNNKHFPFFTSYYKSSIKYKTTSIENIIIIFIMFRIVLNSGL